MKTENEKQIETLDDSDIKNIFYIALILLEVDNIRYSKENTIFLMAELSDIHGSAGMGTLATALINKGLI